ncbi:unnamed protein product [Toxocara canis]|uniref:Uncharacterized protein n=1 Tax=Toxocara canis TaxID=6265 RepID=A0A183UHT9_TOXCA|nr:unnamed protein product [Toxocara canis]
MCSRLSPCTTLSATLLSTLPQIGPLTSCAPTDVIAITSAPTMLLPTLLDPCSAFTCAQQLSLPIRLQPSQHSPDPGTSPNPFSELTALNEPIKPAPNIPLLPSLDSLLPTTFMPFEQQSSSSLFKTTNLTIPSIAEPSTATGGMSVASPLGDETQSSWNTYRRLSAPGCLFVGLLSEPQSQPARRFSDFSINRLLKSQQQSRRASILADSRATLLRHSNHDERTSSGRKQRTIYGASQTRVLERAFEEQQYMVGTGKHIAYCSCTL